MKFIHDNKIESYKVDFLGKKITLKTVNERNEEVDIIFKDVLTHFFEDSSHQNIIFDIKTCTIENFILDNSQLIKDKRKLCWPLDSNSVEDLSNKLEKQEYKYFVIESSNGLSGMVLAKQMDIE